MPQYSQVYALSVTTGVHKCPFDVVTAPQVEHTYVFRFADVFFFAVFFLAVLFFAAMMLSFLYG